MKSRVRLSSSALRRPLATAALTLSVVAATFAGPGRFTAGAAAAPQNTAAPSGCALNPRPPSGFAERRATVNGIAINYVQGGRGPTLLLLHGYPESWYEWDDILPALERHYTVVAPDLPGAGDSAAPSVERDYTKKAMAADMWGLLTRLGLNQHIDIVGHDIGTMVAYSLAAAHRSAVAKLVVSEAPLPDATTYTLPSLTANGPGLWWFGLFNEPGGLAEKLFAGNERAWVYGSMPTLEVVKNALTPCDLAIWTHDLAKPGHLRATIDWFATVPQDITNDEAYGKTKLTMPVLAIGSAHVFGRSVAEQFRHYATHVTAAVIRNSGHWLYEERPAEMTRILTGFLGG